MSAPPIIIAGGGIAGLSAALAIGTHNGLILEQASSFSPVGAGVQLGPNAVRALQKLNAWDAVAPFTTSPPAIHMRDGLTGKRLKILELGQTFEKRYGTPYRAIHRADLHAALASVVSTKPNIETRLKQQVENLTAHFDHVALELNGTTMTCQSLIAVDGVKSRLREALFPEATTIHSGFDFHRAMLPIDSLPSSLADAECVTVWLYAHGHVVHYPVGRNTHLNLVAITPANRSPSQHYTSACSPLQDLLQAAQPSWTIWPGLYVPPLSSWTKGGILLLGDAAHGTLPFLAQGAAMALEDAACLSDAVRTAHSLKHAFAETAATRQPRTTRLHKASTSAGRAYHADGAMRLARNLGLAVIPSTRITAGLDWLYNG